MSKYISVATEYTLYEVPDDAMELLASGVVAQPPAIVLELMLINGKAKKVGSISTVLVPSEAVYANDDDDDSEEEGNDSPWVEDHDDE